MKKLFFCIFALFCAGFAMAQKAQKKPFTLSPKLVIGISPVMFNQNILLGGHASVEYYVKQRWGIQAGWVYPGLYFTPSNKTGAISNYRLPVSLRQETRYIFAQPREHGRFYTSLAFSYEFDKMDKTNGFMKDAPGKFIEYTAAKVTRHNVAALGKIGYQFFFFEDKMTLDLFAGLGGVFKKSQHNITGDYWLLQSNELYPSAQKFNDNGSIAPKMTIGIQIGYVLF